MSSRQEEKERRRQERLAAERAASAAAARKRRLGIVAATVLGVAALAAIGIALTAGGSSPKGEGNPSDNASANIPAVPIPKRQITDLNAAAKAASCKLTNPPQEGRTHTTGRVTYKTNPPTSGNHNPTPASDGNYVGVETPAPEFYVHSLEHGRIQVQYKPGTSRRVIGQLESLFEERPAYVMLFQNNTNMPYDIAATAWTHMLACPTYNPKVFDAIRAFRDSYTLKAPEVITGKE